MLQEALFLSFYLFIFLVTLWLGLGPTNTLLGLHKKNKNGWLRLGKHFTMSNACHYNVSGREAHVQQVTCSSEGQKPMQFSLHLLQFYTGKTI